MKERGEKETGGGGVNVNGESQMKEGEGDRFVTICLVFPLHNTQMRMDSQLR